MTPEVQALPVPKGLSMVEAASLPEASFTVYSNVYDRGRLAPGESRLVQGGSSGMGVTAIQMAAATGNRVFATAGSLGSGYRESSRTRFCLECHEMKPYGVSLFIDNPRAVPATHYQSRLVDRNASCYACHADYAMFGDVKVVVDPSSAPLLRGAMLDYKDALQGGGFAINNPNASRTCGCGNSFS